MNLIKLDFMIVPKSYAHARATQRTAKVLILCDLDWLLEQRNLAFYG